MSMRTAGSSETKNSLNWALGIEMVTKSEWSAHRSNQKVVKLRLELSLGLTSFEHGSDVIIDSLDVAI